MNAAAAGTGTLGRLWDVIWSRTADRKLCFRILDNQALDAGDEGTTFLQDDSYFGIRLSEMFIRDERVLMRTFVPLSVAITEFIYDGKKQIVPYIVGNQLLKSIDPYVQGAHVEFSNTNIAGPIPYAGGGISLYMGLYRAQVNDLSQKLFSLVGTILSSFDTTGLSRYLDVAEPLGAGLADLLGMKEVEFRLGKRDEFGGNDGTNQFKSGYLAYINLIERELDSSRLRVKDGALQITRNGGGLQRFTDADYCLIKIEHISERGDYTALSFHKLWTASKDLIWQGEPKKARGAFVELVRELARSPDLTKKHRFHLLQVYKANFEAELAQFNSITQVHGSDAGDLTRGAGGNSRTTARAAVQAATFAAQKAKLPVAERGLVELTTMWDKIPHLNNRGARVSLTDDVLNSQLKSLQSASAIDKTDPDALATALTLAEFDQR